MRLLFVGDVVGRAGRDAFLGALPGLRERYTPDFVVVNGENAAHGFGLTMKIARSFFEAGVDAIPMGNHVWDQRELLHNIDDEPRIIRPLNYPPGTPGLGARVFRTATGRRVLVAQVMGRLFMDPLDDPFAAARHLLDTYRLVRDVDAAVIDMHGEASSEKMAFGKHFDGRASLIAGTHTHIPTADLRVLPEGTAYISDVGMTGDYESVIGMQAEGSIARVTRKLPIRMEPAEGPATLCAVLVDTDDTTGLARAARPIRQGGVLAGTEPA